MTAVSENFLVGELFALVVSEHARRRSAACNRGYQHNLIALLNGSVVSLKSLYVLVIHEDVDELTEVSVFIEKRLFGFGIFIGKRAYNLARGVSLKLKLRAVICERAKRCWNKNGYSNNVTPLSKFFLRKTAYSPPKAQSFSCQPRFP